MKYVYVWTLSMLIYVHEVCLDVYIPAGGLGGS